MFESVRTTLPFKRQSGQTSKFLPQTGHTDFLFRSRKQVIVPQEGHFIA